MTPPSSEGVRGPRLELLGRLGVPGAGEGARAVLAQPKRLAVLAWIALRRPGGFVRRDELIGTFWGGSEEARGRAALRQALRFLRQKLGPEAVVNRGSGDVALGLTVDAVDLHVALERGDDRAVLELWRGELMPGFALAGVPAFDDWLETERRRLRMGVAAAALRESEAAENRGDLPRAVAAGTRAMELDPLNEEVARRLMSLHARTGNRVAAVAVFEALRDRLVDDLELDPAPETARLVASIRESRPAPGTGRGEPPGPAPGSPARVVVVDLENLTGHPDLDAVGRLAAERIAQGLATMEELEVVPPLALGPASQGEGGPADPMADLARRTRAGTVVGGSYHLEGERLRLQVRIVDVAEGRLHPAPDPVEAPRVDPVPGIERLREGVMTTLGPALTRRSIHVREASRPPGMAAYRAYLDGLDLFIRGEWREALEHFREAAEGAPDYALPRIVRAIALWNLHELDEAQAAADEAQALRSSLGRFERGVLDNVRGWLEGDWAAAHRGARIQAELAPGSIPHFQVAEEARRLNRPGEALRVLSQLDPERGELRGWVFYWIELATAHHLLGDHDREREVAQRARRAHPDHPVTLLLELRALAGAGRDDAVLPLAEEALATPSLRRPWAGELLTEAALELRAHGVGEAAPQLLQWALSWYREQLGAEDSRDPAVLRAHALTLYHAGALEEARIRFQRLARESQGRVQPVGYHHGHLRGHLDEGILAVLAARLGDREAADRWRDVLETLTGPFLYGANWVWLARLAAVEEDPRRAVIHLGRAFSDGLPMSMTLHSDPDLSVLRGFSRFDALMRPRG